MVFKQIIAITTSRMVDAGLAYFGPTSSYLEFGVNTVDALGRAWSWVLVGPYAGTAEGCTEPFFVGNHCNENDDYKCSLHRLELEKHGHDDGHYLVDGEVPWGFEGDYDHDLLYFNCEMDFESPHYNTLNHISLWYEYSPHGSRYEFNNDDVFWDNSDEDNDSTESIFAEDDESEDRRLAAIG